MRTRLTLVLSVAAIAALAAQAPQDRNQPTFRGGVNYVRVDMYATRDGKAVQDIGAKGRVDRVGGRLFKRLLQVGPR